jgi:hypothetical protein
MLGGAVMQLARDASPLGILGVQQPRRGFPQTHFRPALDRDVLVGDDQEGPVQMADPHGRQLHPTRTDCRAA